MFQLEQENRPLYYSQTKLQNGRYRVGARLLVSPNQRYMEDEGLGDLGFSLKKAVKKVTKTAKKVVKAPVNIAKKIPVVGSVVKLAEKVVQTGASLVAKVPIVGGLAVKVANITSPFELEAKKKSSSPVKPPQVMVSAPVPASLFQNSQAQSLTPEVPTTQPLSPTSAINYTGSMTPGYATGYDYTGEQGEGGSGGGGGGVQQYDSQGQPIDPADDMSKYLLIGGAVLIGGILLMNSKGGG